MTGKRKRAEIADDGRVVAKMNVEGMPWHAKAKNTPPPVREGAAGPPLTKREIRSVMYNAVLAGLGIALVFAVVFGLFILFAVHVWLK